MILEWNFWWENKEFINELKGKERQAYHDLISSIRIKEIIILTGIRRSGKSTLMYQMIDNLLKQQEIVPEQILFVNLEDKKLVDYSLEQIYGFYRSTINPKKKAYVFLDEVHKRDGWESWIRKKYDLKENCKFVISGSCSYLLKKEFSTLLTGRNLTFEVYPLSFKEFLGFKGITVKNVNVLLNRTKYELKNNLISYMQEGGFPEILFAEKEFKFKILAQYFDDILYKDIVDRYNLSSRKVKDFALYLMTNFTGLLSLRNLRNSLGLSYDTLKDYLNYYEEAFLFLLIEHFSYSLKEQKTLPSKAYCIDNGLRNAVSFKFSKDAGKLAENLILIELKRRGKNLYYWKGRGEVDFVVKDENLIGINVSYSNEIDPREIKGLLEFKEMYGKRVKKLIILTDDLEKTEKGISYIPLWKFLLS